MSRAELRQGVRAALASIVDPRSGRDIVAAGMVTDIEVDDAGNVRVAFALKPEDAPQLPREARRAVQAVSGVTSAKLR